MAYQDFLEAFATTYDIAGADVLLSEHGQRFAFQLRSRERAREMIDLLQDSAGVDFSGKRVLDVGCAYGSFAVEMANRGASVVGIDISEKWLELAEANARNEVNVRFLNCDAAAFRARRELEIGAPYDVVVVNDVFEHIFDTAGVLENLRALTHAGTVIYYKIPNGLAPRSVLEEGHKKVFGISLLPPDYWSHYVKAPFHIYYRRWSYYVALFGHFGFGDIESFKGNTDARREVTMRHIMNDLARVEKGLNPRDYERPQQYRFLKHAVDRYMEEVRDDLEHLDWDDLFHKYRVTFWEGLLRKAA